MLVCSFYLRIFTKGICQLCTIAMVIMALHSVAVNVNITDNGCIGPNSNTIEFTGRAGVNSNSSSIFQFPIQFT